MFEHVDLQAKQLLGAAAKLMMTSSAQVWREEKQK